MRRAACAAVVAAALLVVPGAGANRDAAPIADPIETPGSPLDIVSARLAGSSTLELTLRTAHRWTADDLDSGRQLCLVLPALHREACVGAGLLLALRTLDPATGKLTGARALAGRATHPDPKTLVVRVRAASLGLGAGPIQWQAATRYGDLDGPCASGCADVAPDAGVATLPRPGGPPPAAPATPPATGIPTGCTVHGRVERHSGPHVKRVALTFDDGPGPDTPGFVRTLEREKAVGTFFMIGQQVPGHAKLLHRMLRDGDMIGNHSYTHANLAGGAGTQISRTNAVIGHATGFAPCLFRPPYGAVSPRLDADVAAAHMTAVLWDVDPTDWARPGTAAIEQRVLGHVHDGAIVIMHDGGGARDQTLAALAHIIHTLRARGYALVTVTDLLGDKLRAA